jgi:dTDP-4-amino-4,6-dideoxygalactose transaminase
MEKIRKYRDHGRIGRYDLVEIGYNARIDNMQSNVVMAKLPYLRDWINRKREICQYYDQQFRDVVTTIKYDPRVGQGHYVYVIQTAHRDQLRNYLESKGIQTNIHYAVTTHTQPAFRPWYTPCPVAEKTVKEILSLPCWYSMTDDQVDYVVDSVKGFFR